MLKNVKSAFKGKCYILVSSLMGILGVVTKPTNKPAKIATERGTCICCDHPFNLGPRARDMALRFAPSNLKRDKS